jgi:DNA-binding transcriptional MerR regulator
VKGKQTKSTAAQKLYRPISEVSALLDVKPHILRYWETQFQGLRPKKNRAGNRMYRPEEIELLARIKHLLKGRRFTVEGARRKLAEEKEQGARGARKPVRVTAARAATAAAKPGARPAARTGSRTAGGAGAKATPAAARAAAEATASRESERRAAIAEVREGLLSLARELRAADGSESGDVRLLAVREPVSA